MSNAIPSSLKIQAVTSCGPIWLGVRTDIWKSRVNFLFTPFNFFKGFEVQDIYVYRVIRFVTSSWRWCKHQLFHVYWWLSSKTARIYTHCLYRNRHASTSTTKCNPWLWEILILKMSEQDNRFEVFSNGQRHAFRQIYIKERMYTI